MRTILEKHNKACVVRKTRDNTDQNDLENKLEDIGSTRVSLEGTTDVGRTPVDNEITEQEHKDILLVFIHLEQSISPTTRWS